MIGVGFRRSEGAQHAESVTGLSVRGLAADGGLAQVLLGQPGPGRGAEARLLGGGGVVSEVLRRVGSFRREGWCEDGAGGVGFAGGRRRVEVLRLEALVELLRVLQLGPGHLPPSHYPPRGLLQGEAGWLGTPHVKVKQRAAVI